MKIKPHQLRVNKDNKLEPKPRFMTTKHRGQQAGAFGKQKKD